MLVSDIFFMGRKNISQEKIIQSFLTSAFEKSAGATSLSDISEILKIKKASLYNHFESRDAMYEATIFYCEKEISSIKMLSDKAIESIHSGKTAVLTSFKKLITRFFNLYENEPLFAMYTFISTEKYFNTKAKETFLKFIEKLEDEIKKILFAFSKNGKIKIKTEKEIKENSAIIVAIIIAQLDVYITNRKETVRQNPDCSAGSLFALPTDDVAVTKTIKMIEHCLKPILN